MLDRFALTLLAMLCALGPGAEAVAAQSFTVNLLYREDRVLPEGSVLTVTLADTAKQDVAADVLAVVERVAAVAPPFSVAFAVEPGWLEAPRQLTLRAEIRAGADLLFVTDTAILAADLLAADGSVDIVMRSAAPPEPVAPPVGVGNLYCTGNEPFWSLDLVGGGMARFQILNGPVPDDEILRGRQSVLGWADPPRVIFQGRAGIGRQSTVATLRREACFDTMADGPAMPYSATVITGGGRVLLGCCQPLE